MRPQSLIRELVGRARRSDFTGKVGETYLTRVSMVFIGMVTSVLVARALGPSGRGLVATAGVVTSIGVQFSNFGFPATNVYYVAKDRRLATSLLGNSLFVGLAVASALSVVACFVFWLFPEIVPIDGSLLVLAIAGVPLGVTVLLMENLLLGLQDVHAYNVVEMTMKVLAVGIILGLVVVGRLTPGLIVGTGLIASSVGLAWTLRRLRSHGLGRPRVSVAVVRKQIGFGLKAYASTFFAFLVLRLDLLMVVAARGAEQAGHYSIAVTMADFLYILPAVVGSILMPRLSELPDTASKWRAAKRVVLVVAVFMSATSVLAAVVASPAVHALYGEAFAPSVPPFWWLLPGMIALGANTVLMIFFASLGMPWVTVYSPLLATIVNVGLNVWLIPTHGIVGAAVSSSAAYLSMLLVSVAYLAWLARRGELSAG